MSVRSASILVCVASLTLASVAEARVVLPREGRFLSPDRSGMIDGPNLYTYVRNLPTMLTDPFGLMSTLVLYNSVLDDPRGKVRITETQKRRTSFEKLLARELASKVFTDSSATEMTMEPVGSMTDWYDLKQRCGMGDAGARFSRIAIFAHGNNPRSIGLLGCDTYGTQSQPPILASGVQAAFPHAAITVVIGSWFITDYQPRPPSPEFTSLSLLLLPHTFP